MTKVNILHFSDIHWHPNNERDVAIVRDAMISDLKDLLSQGLSPNLALFTGDLVLAGENFDHFNMAMSRVVLPILDAAGIERERIIFTPGNHDISRAVVRNNPFLETGMATNLNSVDAVNSYIDKNIFSKDNADSTLSRMENYERFISENALNGELNSRLLRVHKFNISDCKVGVASMNNSWRSTGESGGVDRNRLILGERVVDTAIDNISDCKLRIAAFHHPLTWLTDFDASAVSPRMYSGFDLLAFGHVHNVEPELRKSVTGGSILSQSGALYSGREHFNGYQIISIDTETCEAEVIIRTYYNSPARAFGPAENISKRGYISFDYTPSNSAAKPELEKFLREARGEIRASALSQFNMSDIASSISTDPHTAFICPPIYIKSAATDDNGGADDVGSEHDEETSTYWSRDESSSPRGMAHSAEKEIDLSTILRSESNFVIVGPREAGKTSLAHYASVLISEGETNSPMIPVIVNFQSFTPNTYGASKAFSSYVGVSKTGYDLQRGLSEGEIFFIVDNFDSDNKKKIESIQKFSSTCPNCKWLFLSDERPGRLNSAKSHEEIVGDCVIARIDTLPRRSIRELTRRWCDKIGSDGDRTFSEIMAHIKESDLPRTGYIVTLLLWAFHQNRRMERINEAVLLMNMADYLLGKADFTKSLEREFDATAKEITLQEIAQYLRCNDGASTPNNVTQFLIDYFKTRGLPYDASEVLQGLIECGILARADGMISFKYRCFQEYFLAKYFLSSQSRFASMIEDSNYLNFTREVDLASGLRRENDDLIRTISADVEKRKPESISSVRLAEFEQLIESNSSVGVTQKKLRKIREKRLTSDQIDDLMDAAERRLNKSDRPDGDNEEANAQSQSRRASGSEEQIGHTVNGERVPDEADSSGNSVKEVERFKVQEFLSANDVLGKVLRNSEFSSRDTKVMGSLIYLNGYAEFFLRLNSVLLEVFDQIFDEVFAAQQEDEETSEEALRALKYFLTKNMMAFCDSMISDGFAAHKLSPIYSDILRQSNTSLAAKTFLTSLLIDAGVDNWRATWMKLISETKKQRMTVEFLGDKLWARIHQKAMSLKEREEVEKMAVELELSLGRPKGAKSEIIRGVKKVTDDAERKYSSDDR